MSNRKPNSHIIQYLDYYITLQTPEFAVLLSGEWGSGKTWFIKQFIQTRIDKKEKNFLHVSLFGKKSADEIDAEVFAQLYPVFAGKSAKIASIFARGAVKGWFKVDLQEIKLSDYLDVTHDYTLIFDDVERCSMPISDVLGYINLYVEYQGFRVILVANESVLKSRFSDETGSAVHNDYKSLKEKLIGKTFVLTTDTSAALESFLNLQESDLRYIATCKTLLSQYFQVIEALYLESGTRSLRILKQAIDEFARFYQVLQDDIKQNQEVVEQLLKIFLALSFESRTERVQSEDMKEYIYYQIKFTQSFSSSDEELEKEEEYRKSWEKYKSINSFDMILDENLWFDVMTQSKLDVEKINNSIKLTRYFRVDYEPAIERIYYYKHMSDEEFLMLRETALQELKAGWAKQKKQLLFGLGLLLHLQEIKLLQVSSDALLANAKLNANKILEGKSLDELKAILTANKKVELFSWKAKGYVGTAHPAFKNLQSYFIEQGLSLMLKHFVRQQLGFFSSDFDTKFRTEILLSETDYLIAHHFPLLINIDQKAFLTAFLKADYVDQAGFVQAVKKRFDLLLQLKRNEFLAQESIWLEQLKASLLPTAQAKLNLPSGFRLMELITKGLDPVLAIAAQKLSSSNIEPLE